MAVRWRVRGFVSSVDVVGWVSVSAPTFFMAARWRVRGFVGAVDVVGWVSVSAPTLRKSHPPPTISAERRCEGVIAAALWPRAGIVKGAAASPLNTFARGKVTESARALANGTVHRAYIVALHASHHPAGRDRDGGWCHIRRWRVRLRLPALRLRRLPRCCRVGKRQRTHLTKITPSPQPAAPDADARGLLRLPFGREPGLLRGRLRAPLTRSREGR